MAEKLQFLIHLLEAAQNLADIHALGIYHLHPLSGKRVGQYALDLGRKPGYRLIVIPLDSNGNEWQDAAREIIYQSTKVLLVWEVTNHYE